MAVEVKAPNSYATHKDKFSIFLCGSIEMGAAEDWQQAITDGLKDEDVLIINPRRQNWDSSWAQEITNAPFREQVEWELDGIDACDLAIFYFAPNTKSPITLLELGVCAATRADRTIVCCPDGFWRKGNVDIVCNRHDVPQVKTLADLADAVKMRAALK